MHSGSMALSDDLTQLRMEHDLKSVDYFERAVVEHGTMTTQRQPNSSRSAHRALPAWAAHWNIIKRLSCPQSAWKRYARMSNSILGTPSYRLGSRGKMPWSGTRTVLRCKNRRVASATVARTNCCSLNWQRTGALLMCRNRCKRKNSVSAPERSFSEMNDERNQLAEDIARYLANPNPAPTTPAIPGGARRCLSERQGRGYRRDRGEA